MTKKVILEFPSAIPKLDKKILHKAKEAMVMELLRKAKISQGMAVELLEISRSHLFDVMAKYDVPVINMTKTELKEELNKNLEFKTHPLGVKGRLRRKDIYNAARDILEKTAGAWKDTVDCEKLIKNIYADRKISTRKAPKL